MLEPGFWIAGIEDAIYKQLDDQLRVWIPQVVLRQYEGINVLFCIPGNLQDTEILAESSGLQGGVLLSESKTGPMVDAPSYLLERLPIHPENIPYIVTVHLPFERKPFEFLNVQRNICQIGGQLTAHFGRNSRGSRGQRDIRHGSSRSTLRVIATLTGMVAALWAPLPTLLGCIIFLTVSPARGG